MIFDELETIKKNTLSSLALRDTRGNPKRKVSHWQDYKHANHSRYIISLMFVIRNPFKMMSFVFYVEWVRVRMAEYIQRTDAYT